MQARHASPVAPHMTPSQWVQIKPLKVLNPPVSAARPVTLISTFDGKAFQTVTVRALRVICILALRRY